MMGIDQQIKRVLAQRKGKLLVYTSKPTTVTHERLTVVGHDDTPAHRGLQFDSMWFDEADSRSTNHDP
jgi:hypothetical protein